MNQDEVVALMMSSKSESEWNAHCDMVKKACGGDYPPFWYEAIVLSGVMRRTSAKWGGDDQIRVMTSPAK